MASTVSIQVGVFSILMAVGGWVETAPAWHASSLPGLSEAPFGRALSAFAATSRNGVAQAGVVDSGCDFNTDLGWNIRGKLVSGPGGLYGTTYHGGKYDFGSIFRYNPDLDEFVTLHSFDGNDGRYPYTGLTPGLDSKLYGSTFEGGSGGEGDVSGTIFRFDPVTGSFETLNYFDQKGGTNPNSTLVELAPGVFFGTTVFSAYHSGGGSIFRFDLNRPVSSQYVTLHNWDDPEGRPYGELQSLGGYLYGALSQGGSYANGSIYRISPTAGPTSYSVRYEFSRPDGPPNDGRNPYGGLMLDDGKLYGTTHRGGVADAGTVFVFNPAIDPAADPTGSLRLQILHNFDRDAATGLFPTGAGPFAQLTLIGDELWGTTTYGGANDYGTLFKVSISERHLTDVASFTAGTGAYPFSQVSADYVATTQLGPNGYGSIVQVRDPYTGAFGIWLRHALTGVPVVRERLGEFIKENRGALVRAGDGALYGTSYLGGASNFGTIFKCDPASGVGSVVYHFPYDPHRDVAAEDPVMGNSPNGRQPQDGVVVGVDGALYGTTSLSGQNRMGTVFRFDTAGVFEILHHFDRFSDGAYPNTALVRASGGIYGTTVQGGPSDGGTIFRITDDHVFESLFSFSALLDGGANPRAALAPASDGALYGTTSTHPALFRFDPASNTLSVVYTFAGAADAPYAAALIQGHDGWLYGTTPEGPNYPFGSIFRVDPGSGTHEDLHAFDTSDPAGAWPIAGLTRAANGSFYGTTLIRGAGDGGTVFRYDPFSRLVTTIRAFPYGDQGGFMPMAAVTETGANTFAGTAAGGAPGTHLRVYEVVDPAPPVDVKLSMTDTPDPVGFGDALTFSIVVENAGASTAHDVSVTDSLPAALQFTSVSTSQGTCSAATLITCALGSVAPAQRVDITLVAGATAAGTVTNTASVSGGDPDRDPSNNAVTTSTLVEPASLSHTLTVSVAGSGSVTSVPSGINCPGACSHAFSSGTSVTLTAAASVGSNFASWGGACTGTTSCVVTMDLDRSISATFTTAGRDLIVAAISNPPALLSPGSAFTVTDTTRNQGTVDAGSSTTRYYLSLDALKGAGDSKLSGSRAVPALPVGIASTGTASVTVPKTLALGTYRLLACADDTKLVVEVNENNNCIAAPGTITVGLPDLVETAGTPPPTAAPGSTFTAADTVQNAGTVPAAASKTAYYLSADGVRDAGDVVLSGTRSIDMLTPGATSAGTKVVTIPAAMPLGTYHLLACADDLLKVPESNEINNCAASAGTVIVAWPDLVTVAVSNPSAGALRGGQFTLTDTVANQGNAAAAASTTRYYLSADTVKDAGDLLLTGNRSVASLSPGATSTGSKKVTVPTAAVFGTYSVLACADDLLKVGESDNGNNCRASGTTVIIHP